MKKIYVADFGAGNTCLYFANPDANIREASPLNDPAGEPSGYAVSKRGDVLLGLGLYSITYQQLQDIDYFHINIKAKPNTSNKDEMVKYFRAWREKLEEDRPEEFKDVDEPYWFIGCPTGEEWKCAETREMYKTIFEEAGYRNVFIIPESNAAFAYFEKTNQITYNNSAKSNYLLFDQGAYSLDATLYNNGKVESFGGYLGASLIERMMIHIILESEEERIRVGKRMINLPETLEGAQKLFKAEGIHGKFYTYLLLQARKLKERYFTALKNEQIAENVDLKDELDFTVNEDALVLFTNRKMMNNILEKYPIMDVLGNEFHELAPEVQQNIGKKTWMQVFRDFLSNVDKKFPDVVNGTDTVIMLTGGGSLMPSICDAIKEHYPQATIHYDRDAIFAIGKGMAYWAPDKIKAKAFEDAFERFINKEEIDDDGDTVNCVVQHLNKGYVDCVVPTLQAIEQEECEAVTYGIVQWREYNCNSGEIPSIIESHLQNWCRDTGIPNFKSDIKRKITELKEILNRSFNTVLDEYNLPQEDILKADDEVFLSDTSRLIPELFSCIVNIVIAHYKECPIWDSFTNDRKKIFSNPRNDLCSAMAQELSEWLVKEANSTFDLCKEVFSNMEFEITDDFKCDMNKLFIWEGYTDLINLMKSHVKSILGQLVLEEYINE